MRRVRLEICGLIRAKCFIKEELNYGMVDVKRKLQFSSGEKRDERGERGQQGFLERISLPAMGERNRHFNKAICDV